MMNLNDGMSQATAGTKSSPLPGLDVDAFRQTLANARQHLLDARNEQGWWTGELSSSALATATAIVAMTLAQRHGSAATGDVQPLIERGLQWLLQTQNEDGGWGDTDKSKSNISTTMLVWAVMGLVGEGTEARRHEGTKGAITRCEGWLANHAGSMEVAALVEAVMKRYGKDRTFSVPILTMCALCGRLGPVEDAATWKWVKQLPFEFAAFPRSWFKVLNLQVVSYALPALIAIGLVRHQHRPTWNPVARLARQATKARVMRLLEEIQPSSGGFLEATPLTSFVTMSLAACGFAAHPVVTRGVEFLKQSARADGSWPIDTNLATWVTTLSVNALAVGGKLNESLNEDERTVIRDWLLKQQYKEVHPYTGAAPGGWAWTDLPGGVPDADDTSGAVIALRNLEDDHAQSHAAADAGLRWLASLQNADGGIPTFCRGWGRLPFDRSNPDITAHFLVAARQSRRSSPLHASVQVACERAEVFLRKSQRPDGAFVPLWFGNQHQSDELNLTYGTAKVAMAKLDVREGGAVKGDERYEGVRWLLTSVNDDGGWGGDAGIASSIEETALAVEALALQGDAAKPRAALVGGVNWLIEHTARGTSFPPSVIGFYFAKLWYYEKLYSVIFTVAALERVAAILEME